MSYRDPISQEEIESFLELVPPVTHNPTSGRTPNRTFNGVRFIAHPLPGAKFNRNGELLIGLAVPNEYRDAGYLLLDMMEKPVLIIAKPWNGDRVDEFYLDDIPDE